VIHGLAEAAVEGAEEMANVVVGLVSSILSAAELMILIKLVPQREHFNSVRTKMGPSSKRLVSLDLEAL
jgi:hypothetical protein